MAELKQSETDTSSFSQEEAALVSSFYSETIMFMDKYMRSPVMTPVVVSAALPAIAAFILAYLSTCIATDKEDKLADVLAVVVPMVTSALQAFDEKTGNSTTVH